MSEPLVAAAAVEKELEALLGFLYVAPVGLVETDETGAISLMTPLAAQLLLPIAGAGGVANLFAALADVAPDLRLKVAGYTAERGPICDGYRIHLGSHEGREALIVSCTLIRIEPGRIMAALTDVTEQAAQERRLKQAESWFSIILSGVKDFALLSLNANGRVQSWNKSGERLTGHSGGEIVGHTLNVIYPPAEAVQGRALQQVDFARRDGWHIDEGWRRRKDGKLFWCQSLVSAMEERSGEVSGFSVVLRDVTEQRTNGEELRRLLTTDQLTGLLNRTRFFELAEAEVARWDRFGTPLTCLMIDVDHFKHVNDTYGHAGGDAVLCELANLFRRGLRTIDVVGRLGGEEFAILLPSIDLAGARSLAELLRCGAEAMRPKFEGRQVDVTISVGCAQLGPANPTIDLLLRAADRALYEAKHAGRNRVVLHEQSDPTSSHLVA